MFTTYDKNRSITALIGEVARLMAQTLGRSVSDVYRAHRARRALSMLARQDDYMLRDIGVTRGDLNIALSTPAGDPSDVLARLARERQQAERARRRRISGEIG